MRNFLFFVISFCGTATCHAQFSFSIQQQEPVFCFGGTNAKLVAHATGGVTPYEYEWVKYDGGIIFLGQTDSIATGLSSGNYSVRIKDANGNSANPTGGDTYFLDEPQELFVDITSLAGCFGTNSGSATATGFGGTPPYSYLWSNGATTATASNLAAGKYTVILKDFYNCAIASDTAFIAPVSAIAIQPILQQPVAGCNGTVSLTVSGGTAPYSYNWSNGSTTKDLTNLCGGNYTVTITDTVGCMVQQSYSLSLVYNVSVQVLQQVSCNGGSDGKLAAHTFAGIPPYQYQWYNANTGQAIIQTDSIASGLAAGSYYVKTFDANGNPATSTTISLAAPSAISLQFNTNSGCFGTASATATVIAIGGTGSYTYLWLNNATTATISNLAAANYTVTVKDVNQCTVTGSTKITSPTALTVLLASTNSSCQNNGTASATASGGTGTYKYLWSNGPTTAAVTNLSAGAYLVTATDENNCSVTGTATITQPAPIAVQITATPALCFNGASGSANAVVSGGTAPYNYSWSNGSTSSSATNLAAGNYYLLVSDANNCGLAPQNFTISQPGAPLTVQISGTNILPCFGSNNGSATVVASGGTGPYTFLWSNGATTANINNLTAGNYNVTIKDTNQCAINNSITIAQPAVLNIQFTTTNVTCGGTDGAAAATVTGGVAPYTYLWSNGVTTSSINNLSAGTYTVSVKDVNQCSITGSFSIRQPVNLSLSIAKRDVTCYGNSDGTAATSVSGGVQPYTYQWSNGTTTSALGDVAAGTYNVIIKDANQCSVTGTAIVTQPAMFGLTLTATNVSCFGAGDGTATIQATGGTVPYTYHWNNGATSQTVTGLSPATRFLVVYVSDANGCASPYTGTNSIVITEPAELKAVMSSANVPCFGGVNGSATATISGGTLPYTYLWSTGAVTSSINAAEGTYTVVIKDANQCTTAGTAIITAPSAPLSFTVSATMVNCFGGNNATGHVTAFGGTAPYTYLWSNGTATSIAGNLIAGIYTFTVTDINNCSTTGSINITEPTPMAVQMLHTNVTCFGGTTGSATAVPSGGLAPYTYLWQNGAATATIIALQEGTYAVTIKDVNQCTATGIVTVTQAQSITIQMATTNAPCFATSSGTAIAMTSGGTSPYQYLWSTGDTTNNISNLIAGNYSISIRDANNCTTTQSVTITQPAQLNVQVTKTAASCFGFANGSATANASGGTAPYQYTWTNGGITASIINIAAGAYTVTVKDSNHCNVVDTSIITDPIAVSGQIISSTNVSCFGGNNGAATIAGSGGTAPYSYAWSNGDNTATTSALSRGIYSVDITDAKACTGTVSVTIAQRDPLNLAIKIADVNCFGQSTGSVDVTATGGLAPYRYSWPNGAITSSINNLVPGTYTITVKDSGGCSNQATAIISQPSAALTAQVSTTNITPCFQSDNGTAAAQAYDGTAPYQYRWSNGAITDTIANLAAGNYTATITDAKGCIVTANKNITQPISVLDNIGADRTLCEGQNLVINATGNYSGATYLLTGSNGLTSTSAVNTISTPGTYYVRVTNNAGCIGRDTIVISNAPNTINADFIVSSQAFKSVPVVMVNITSPAPDSIRWLIPNDPRITIDSFSQVKAHLVFNDTGTYFISMKSMVGQCEKTVTKKIIVLPRDSTSTGTAIPSVFDPLIRELTVSPNPTSNGQITVRVVLKNIMPVRLRIIDLTSGQAISDLRRSGLKIYQEGYILNNMIAGIYMVLLESGTESSIFKFIRN